MLFHTPIFFAFFAVFFALYAATQRNLKAQNLLILAGSYIFYGAWDHRFLVLIIISTVTDFIAAIGAGGQRISSRDVHKSLVFLLAGSTLVLANDFSANALFLGLVYAYAIVLYGIYRFLEAQSNDHRKLWLALSVVVNLGLLGVFKYFNFFAESLVDLAAVGGISLSATTLSIVLPVGISFYTFQTMSYTIDVYRKKLRPSHALIEVSAYIAFFPQLVAGPIERGASLLPQFFVKRELSFVLIRSGLYLFLWGMFKKAVIADNLSLLSDPVFADSAGASSGVLLVALLAFTFQIYCDFSGYSDMARGVARMMGFNLMVNFNVPYVSKTPSEFWRRWHISLSSWLRDYLYIPLGGNRKGEWGTYKNLSLTMILGGLWHGASWTFVLWGVTHGAVLVIYRLLKIDEWLAQSQTRSAVFRYTQNTFMAFVLFMIVVFTWLLFRAQNFEVVTNFLGGIFAFTSMAGEWGTLLMFVVPLWMHDAWQVHKGNGEFIQDLPGFMRLNVVLFIVCSFIFLQPGGEVAFLYFDF